MIHTKKATTRAAVLASAFVAASVLYAPTASADSPPVKTRTHTSTPMKVVGFDAKVAEAHGYRIVTINGKQSSVLKGTSHGNPQMKNTVYGNCGSSFVDAYRVSRKPYVSFSTGYSVYTRVVEKSWSVGFNSFSDGGAFTFSGKGTGSTWNSGVQSVFVKGKGIAHVSGGSHAVLVDGAICYSGTPTDPYS